MQNSQKFVQTFGEIADILISVNPPIHYIVFATPHKKRNTFYEEARLPQPGLSSHFHEGNEPCENKGRQNDCLQAFLTGIVFIGRKPVTEENRRFFEVIMAN